MATCITKQFGNEWCPQVRLTVTESASTGDTATLSWKLEYLTYASLAASTGGVKKSYSVTINGAKVASGTYDIDGKKGSSYTIKSGTVKITKKTSKQTIKFSCSFEFGLYWHGTYGGTKSASGSISVAAKTSYTVTYNANGGSGAPGKQTKWYGTALKLSTTKPTRTGYTFLGWSTSASATSATWAAGGSYTANASDTLYAVWKANTYTVSYNANGGSGAPANQTKTYGVTLKLSTTKPTRTNYNFLGWGTSAGSTTVAYAAGANYTTNAAITLYAIWELAYTVPRITNASVDRCNSSGTLDDSGTCAVVEFDWATDKAVTQIYLEYMCVSTSVSQPARKTISASGTSGHIKQVINDYLFDTEYVYQMKIVVTDSMGSNDINLQVSQISYILDFRKGGKGLAIGKPADKDGFQVDFESEFRKAARFYAAAYMKNKMYIDNNIGLAMALSGNASYLDVIKINSSNQVELNWTSGGLKGRVMKKLWEGTWSSGSITIADLPYYNVLVMKVSTGTTPLLVVRNPYNGKTIRGISGYPYTSTGGKRSFYFYGFNGEASGTTLEMVNCHKWSIYPDSPVTSGNNTTESIAQIWGVL